MSTIDKYVYRANKDSSQQQTRKYVVIDGKRFGYLEYLVLEFAGKHVLIQAASVREYLKHQGVEVDVRRIHDALQRLLRKGIIEKASRGVYRLTEYGKKILNTLLAKTHKESGFKAFVADGDGVVYASGGFYRARFHVFGGRSLEDLVRQLYAIYRAIGCAVRYLRELLGRNRFYRIVRDVRVECVDYFVGGHGASVLGRSRSLKRPLIDLSYFVSLGLLPKEIGVDVFAAVSGVKPSVKIYFG